MPDDPQPGDLPHNIRRVGARDRKPKLNRSADPFAALPPLPPDLPEGDPPAAETPPAPIMDEAPPPVVVEDDPVTLVVMDEDDPTPIMDEDDPAPVVADPTPEAEPDPPPAPVLDPVADDIASLIDELDSGLMAVVPVDDAPPVPADDPDAAFKPPVDRFPPLPHETAELEAVRPALKTAPASASGGKASRAAERPASREERARAYAEDRARVESAAPPPGRQRALPNLLALLFFLGAILALGFIVTVWNNPFTALNPLPPLTPMPIIITATYTPTLTLTPSPTPTPTLTPTPAPTDTPSPVPTATAEGGIVDSGSYRFAVDNNRTLYLTNPDTRGGCAWSSIAGSVTDRAGQPVNGFSVRIVGDGVDVTVITGSVPGFGPGGFEHQTGREAAVRDFTAQLIDPAGTAVSAAYPFRTSDRCDWNIAAIRFVEVGE